MFKIMCKRLEPVRVRRSKYLLLLLWKHKPYQLRRTRCVRVIDWHMGPWNIALVWLFPPAEANSFTYRYRRLSRFKYPLHQMPPRTRLLEPEVFKLSCSTHFTHFLCLVSVYQPFHLYFIPKTLSTMPLFSAPFLQLMSV